MNPELIAFLERHQRQGAVRVELVLRTPNGTGLRLDSWAFEQGASLEALSDQITRWAARDAEQQSGSISYLVRPFGADGAVKSNGFELRYEGAAPMVPAADYSGEKDFHANLLSAFKAQADLLVRQGREAVEDARKLSEGWKLLSEHQAGIITALTQDARESNRLLRSASMRRDELALSQIEAEIKRAQVQAQIDKDQIDQVQQNELGEKVVGYIEALLTGKGKMPESIKGFFDELGLEPDQLRKIYSELTDTQRAKFAILHTIAMEAAPAAPAAPVVTPAAAAPAAAAPAAAPASPAAPAEVPT